MPAFRAPVFLVALSTITGCVFYPTGSGYHYEEIHHHHDDGAYVVTAPARPADRVPLGYGEAESPCRDAEPWEDTPCQKAGPRRLFEEDFSDGLGRWKACAPWSRGMSWKLTDEGHRGQAAVLTGEDGEIPGGARLGTSWIVTRKPIDLRQAVRPRLRIRLKGGDGAAAVQFRLVWAVAGGAYEEERPIGGAIAAQRGWTLEEADLSALVATQGRLMVVARVDEPDGAFSGPMIDEIAIDDLGD